MQKTADDYGPEYLTHIRQTCLLVLPELGDVLENVTVVGGAVPSLLIREPLPAGVSPHIGTVDLDLTLTLGASDASQYWRVVEELQRLGFTSCGDNAIATSTRWQNLTRLDKPVIVDVLPLRAAGASEDLAAIPTLAPAMIEQLLLAQRDREQVVIEGSGPDEMPVQASPWVCGPGAYVIIKTLTFESRNQNKDAYDLYYVLRNYGSGVHQVAERFARLMNSPQAKRAVTLLESYFVDEEEKGPQGVADFLRGRPSPEIQADVVGHVRQLLATLLAPRPRFLAGYVAVVTGQTVSTKPTGRWSGSTTAIKLDSSERSQQHLPDRAQVVGVVTDHRDQADGLNRLPVSKRLGLQVLVKLQHAIVGRPQLLLQLRPGRGARRPYVEAARPVDRRILALQPPERQVERKP